MQMGEVRTTRPVSNAFLAALTGSHQLSFRATVLDTFQTGVSPTGGVDVPVLGGSVTHDGSAALRSSLDLTTTGFRQWPRRVTDSYAPYGNEIYIEVGVRHREVEWVGLGYHRIREPDQQTVPDGPIRLECDDRMAAIVDARLLAPRQFTAGTTLGAVVSALVTEVYPSAVIEWDDATDTVALARKIVAEEDRYQFLKDLVESHSKIFYFDHRGVLTIRSLPDPTMPVYDIRHGRGGVLVSASRRLTRDGVYNAVVATGEGGDTTTPVRGTATDNNPDSPTYYLGRFGKVPRFFSSPLLATNAQAAAAAATLLRRQLGLPYVVKFGAVTNAALEPYDPVTVHYGPNDAPETHVLERLTIPLAEGTPMTADTKQQAVTLIGSVT